MRVNILGVLGLLIGIGLFWAGFMQLRNRAALNLWSRTKGKVIERGTHQIIRAPMFRHSPLVKYVYQVGGKEFVSDSIYPKRFQPPEQHRAKERAQKRAESFADEVTVHYNPQDPGESFLVPIPQSYPYIFMGASCLVILLSVMFYLTK